MNDYEDYFSILNLSNKASLQDIKKAYRILSIKYHPDKNHNANPELFNKVNEAYGKTVGNKSAQVKRTVTPKPIPQKVEVKPKLEELTEAERELEDSFEDDIEVEKIKAKESKK
jgi:hypothetical protein